MELREYMSLLLLTYGDRGYPDDECVLSDSGLDYDLWEEALDADFICQPRGIKDDWGTCVITPKGLEFIKNGT
jgi:hypothetical protein